MSADKKELSSLLRVTLDKIQEMAPMNGFEKVTNLTDANVALFIFQRLVFIEVNNTSWDDGQSITAFTYKKVSGEEICVARIVKNQSGQTSIDIVPLHAKYLSEHLQNYLQVGTLNEAEEICNKHIQSLGYVIVGNEATY